jgi:predicted lipoprotein with Yx(FWY)xxD motif
MLAKHQMILTALAATLTLATGCATHQASDASASKTAKAAAQVGATHYTVVNFPQGQDTLSNAELSKLRELSATAQQHGKVQEIQVLAWADREYPVDGQKVSAKDSDLADNRAVTIKDYLKKDLNTSADIESHNMAKRPGVFAELVKSDDFAVKSTFEDTGAAPNDVGTRQALVGNKASKAIILVKYE